MPALLEMQEVDVAEGPLTASVFVLRCACGETHLVHDRVGVLPCGRLYDVTGWGK